MTKVTKVEEAKTVESVDAKYEALSAFVDAVVNKDDDAMAAAFTAYAIPRSKEIMGLTVTEDAEPKTKEDEVEDKYETMAKGAKKKTRDIKKPPLKKMKKTDEAVVAEDADPKDKEEDDAEDKYVAMAKTVKPKTRDIKKPELKKMKKTDESVTPSSAIRIMNKDVFVHGKQVGSIENDLSKVNSNIRFKDMTDQNGKDFENISELYKHLVDKFDVQGDSPLDDEGKVKE